jgi:hypothetical protein
MVPRSAILIVDDSDDDTVLLTKMLQRSKILNPIHSVTNVQDAVCYINGEGKYADRQTPILIFIDRILVSNQAFNSLTG